MSHMVDKQGAPTPKKPFWKKTMTGWLILSGIWVAAIALVAVPSWRQALVYHNEVRSVEAGLAELDTWTVAGKWLGKSLSQRESMVNTRWEKTFPAARQREGLFLTLAKVADTAGVSNFNLEEVRQEGTPSLLVSPPEESTFGGNVYGVPVEVPRVTLDSYRVKASFMGSYHQAADFLGGLQSISRAVSVHDLVFSPKAGEIRVDLELDVYVSQQS